MKQFELFAVVVIRCFLFTLINLSRVHLWQNELIGHSLERYMPVYLQESVHTSGIKIKPKVQESLCRPPV